MIRLQLIDRLRQRLVSRFWNAAHAGGGIATWLAEPAVRRAVNRRITGSPDVWPIEWLGEGVVEGPFEHGLSLGCGEGALERDLLAKGVCRRLLGLDVSERALDHARERAEAEGWAELEYQRADLDRLRLAPGSFDAVFVHQALHHVREIEACLDQVRRALPPGGTFYLDEYVGPSRREWRRPLLAAAEDAYRRLPAAVRRRRRPQLPVDWRDPSEAVRSSEILPLVAERFAIRERRDYGGNLFAVIYPHLRLEGREAAEREEVMTRLVALEDELLAAGAPSFYTVVVAAR